MKAYVTNLGKYNEGELVGKWLELPTTDEEIQKTLKEIGIGEEYEEYFITDYEDTHGIELGEYENIQELNEKAETLAEYSDELIQAITESYTSDIDRVIEILENDNYVFYENMTLEEVAEELVDQCYNLPEIAQRYFDYSAFARDLGFDGYCETSTGVILYE